MEDSAPSSGARTEVNPHSKPFWVAGLEQQVFSPSLVDTFTHDRILGFVFEPVFGNMDQVNAYINQLLLG